jgi:hypothetical protein
MLTKFLLYLLSIAVSINCFAQSSQSKEQIGIKLAQCAAYNLESTLIAEHYFKDKKMMDQREHFRETQLAGSIQIIGLDKAKSIYSNTSKSARAYLKNNRDDYVTFVGRHNQECDNWQIKNTASIVQSLNQSR